VNYTVVIPEPEESDQYTKAQDIFVLPEVYEDGSTLNADITAVERTINRFLIDHSHFYGRGVSRRIRPLADSLINVLNAEYASHPSDYFKTHLFYRFATFEIETNHSRTEIHARYFAVRNPA